MLSSCFRRTLSAFRNFTIGITKPHQHTTSSTLQRPVFNFLRNQTHPPPPSHWNKYAGEGKTNNIAGSPNLFLTAQRRFYCNEENQGCQFRDAGWCKRIFQKRRKVCKVIAYGVVTCTVITSGALFFRWTETVPYTKRRHLRLISILEERSDGDNRFERKKKEELKEKILPATHPHSVRVDLIFSNIIKAMRKELVYEQNGKQREAMVYLDELNWEVLVVDEQHKPIYEVNASAAVGGKIQVSSIFLEEFTTDSEIATIVGHEIAHCVARHPAELVTQMSFLIRYGWVLDVFGVYRVLVFNLFWPSITRQTEIEAGYIGMLLMAAAGYDPRIAPGVCKRLDEYMNKEAETDPPPPEELIHPPDEERARLLAQPKVMEEALTLYRKFHRRQHLGDTTEHIAGDCTRQEETLQLQSKQEIVSVVKSG